MSESNFGAESLLETVSGWLEEPAALRRLIFQLLESEALKDMTEDMELEGDFCRNLMEEVTRQLKKLKGMIQQGKIPDRDDFIPERANRFLVNCVQKEFERQLAQPVAITKPQETPTTKSRGMEDTTDIRKALAGRVLVVDDEPEVRRMLRVLLQRKGYQVDEATDGEDAFHKLDRGDYSLVLLDLLMPVLGGEQLLLRMRRHYKMKNTRVIVISGAKDKELLERMTKLHVKSIVLKPFDLDHLLCKVTNAI